MNTERGYGVTRTVTELPPQDGGHWGPETVFMGGVEYSRLHGGRFFEQSRTCRFWWGDWRCEKAAHGPEERHSLVMELCEDDIDPRLT